MTLHAAQHASGAASGSANVGATTTVGVAATMKNLNSVADHVGLFLHGIRATFRQENVMVQQEVHQRLGNPQHKQSHHGK